ncbi:MAG: hypothetical protein JOZ12_10610 [Sinobacteraceae bacterium]|nr:hypothetical protein [Nevskiaceae bacterium]
MPDAELIVGWRARIARAHAYLGWPAARTVVRTHLRGASFALTAPPDQLFTATEVNEWALCAALLERDAAGPTSATPLLDESGALARLQELARAEARPRLPLLLAAADDRALVRTVDDERVTLGAGCGAADFGLDALPCAQTFPWQSVHNIPTALVTGSNGKTSSVRLIAACLAAQGLRCGYCSTDGVFVGSDSLTAGDYSGPAGARLVLREPSLQAAVLETARGGILRRGIAPSRANAALVTNISADHFGEYGIFDLDALADVKLTVGSVVSPHGLLVLNADDATLVRKATQLSQRFAPVPPLGWFALDADNPLLCAHRSHGGATSGFRRGRLVVNHAGAECDLGAAADMPLSLGAAASYNMANLAGAALTARALGVDAARLAQALGRFGADPRDNFGRLMRFEVGGAQVLLDYAHNPDGLRALLGVAERLRAGRGRLGLMLGHAGNRQDSELQQLASVAAEFRPSLVVVKENERHLRGREPGEVPRILRAALLAHGVPAESLPLCMSELEAARRALQWAGHGDVLVLPVHGSEARAELVNWLQQRSASPPT